MLGTSTVERWEVCISAFIAISCWWKLEGKKTQEFFSTEHSQLFHSRQILSIGVDEFLNGLLEFLVKWKTHEWSQSLGALLFILNQ